MHGSPLAVHLELLHAVGLTGLVPIGVACRPKVLEGGPTIEDAVHHTAAFSVDILRSLCGSAY
jgi:hypothetical protein